MKPVLGIYGSGGGGRDIADTVSQIQKTEYRWSEVFFIDDQAMEAEKNGIPLLTFENFRERVSPDNAEILHILR